MSLLPITIEQTNQVLEALPEDQQLHLFARHSVSYTHLTLPTICSV